MAEADWRALVVDWFPELADAGLRQVSWPVIEVHRDYIAARECVATGQRFLLITVLWTGRVLRWRIFRGRHGATAPPALVNAASQAGPLTEAAA